MPIEALARPAPRFHRRIAGLLLVLMLANTAAVAVAVAATAAVAAAAAGEPNAPRFAQELSRADSLDRAGDRAGALEILEPLVEMARAENDSLLLADSLRLKGRVYFITNRIPESEGILRESLALSRAVGDTSLHVQVINVLAFVLRVQGKRDEARGLYEEQLAMAAAAGIRMSEASAMQILADDEREAGRFDVALAEYRKVLLIFEEIDAARGQCTALLRIGACLASMGDLEAGRDAFARCVAIARTQINFERLELAASNNIARIEMDLGDPGTALAALERNYELELEIGSILDASLTARDIAEARLKLGQTSVASEVLERILPIVLEEGLASEEIELRGALAVVREAQSRHAEAASIHRWVLAQPEGTPIEPKIHATRGLSRCLAAQDSSGAALALLEDASRLRAQGTKEVRILFDIDLAGALMDARRPRDALMVLRRIDREADEIELDRYRVGALTRAAICHLNTDQPDSALALFARATTLWEFERTVPLDQEWRALRSLDAHELATRYAALVLDHPREHPESERIEAAFDLLQRFKARTLLERLVRPGDSFSELAASAAPTTLDEIQGAILQPGELLLDLFVADPVMMVGVTREQCRILTLPIDESAIDAQVDLIRRVLASPPRELSDLESVNALTDALGELLLSGFDDLLAEADQLLFAPSGVANLVPLSLLRRPAGSERRALLETHRVARIPSATVLAWNRRGSRPVATPTAGLLAIAGGRAAGQARLPGARREVEELARRYRGVELREPADLDGTVAVLEELANFEIVHVSAHTALDDERPWHSGIILGIGDPSAQPVGGTSVILRSGNEPGELMLRASDIVQLDLPARLAVLSACETGTGKILSGEGVQGLATAFLGAGVETVIATLWPVDDATAARWVSSFYGALADGESTSGAARNASLELHSDPATRHPFYWAGFVLVGDGNSIVDLEARRSIPWLLILAGLLLVAAFGFEWRRRASRTRRINAASAG